MSRAVHQLTGRERSGSSSSGSRSSSGSSSSSGDILRWFSHHHVTGQKNWRRDETGVINNKWFLGPVMHLKILMLPLSLTQVFLPEGLAGVFSSLLQQPGFKKIVQFWFAALLTLSKNFPAMLVRYFDKMVWTLFFSLSGTGGVSWHR